MKIQAIISCLVVLFSLNSVFAQANFTPVPEGNYSINSPFSAYDITNKNGTGMAEMGSRPYNQWSFERVGESDYFRMKELKSGKYLHIQNDGIEVGNIQPNWYSAMWKLERVSGNYFRIKCRWEKYGAPLYLQNPKRSLSIGQLADKSAKYGQWRVRLDGFKPSSSSQYTINSPFSAYDITNKNAAGIAEMGSRPYNRFVFEHVDSKYFRIKEVKTGKYLHIQNDGIEMSDIQPNWYSAMWELEHVSGNYFRIKCRWEKYGAPLYLQNPKRSLSIGQLADKSAKYGQWRVRKEG